MNIANQLFFAYYKLILEFRIFIFPFNNITKTSNFIYLLKKKQKV